MTSTGARHKWDYGSADARSSRQRTCTWCWARGSRFGPGSTPWGTTLPDGTIRLLRVPPCPGTPWFRHVFDDKSVGWVLPGSDLRAWQKIITPAAMTRHGRDRMAASLKEQNLPPLPEAAWKDAA